jgi:Ca-activated chloride channel family protein
MKSGSANFLSKEFLPSGVSGSCGQSCAAALRETTMPRFKLLHVTSLAALLLASCTQSASRIADAGATDRDSTGDLVVSGQRVDMREELADAASRAASIDQSTEPGTPPPPPPMVSMPAPAPFGAMKAMNRGFSISRQAMRAPEPLPPRYYHDEGRDKFDAPAENAFKLVREEPVSTFSLDVDTASYAFVRASLNRNVLPQPASVRTEEMVNYFRYDYARPVSKEVPFSNAVSVFPSPFTPGRKIVRIGVRGYDMRAATRPRANLVFLIDTSGSMYEPNKLPLVKQALSMLLDTLDERDRVAIVTYAGNAGVALEPTPASDKARIRAVLNHLEAGGSTAGAEGIRQAYALAEQNFMSGGVNRVMLATDGDFNVGITSTAELKGYVERERGKGVFLSVLGFGMGNYNDAMMQTLAQNGNGAAAYIDTLGEARKVLVDEASGTLFPIAKDVKIQVEFNPATVAEYRLIGYETRMLNREDFDNDHVDAGDVGAGQTVTALYEIVPVGGPRANPALRYQHPAGRAAVRTIGAGGSEYGFVKIRYKLPKSEVSRLIATPIDHRAEAASFEAAPQDARFATSVAAFAELLKGGKYSGRVTYDDVLRIANGARGEDAYGHRAEFVQMVRAAKSTPALPELATRR